ncbi:MAG: ATP-binding protein, partial [Treponema sp.]|nr:ATP-binding protein [Treponema sp.]
QRDGRIAVITTAVDITARLAAEREAKRQECLLIQSDKIASLGLLVAGMAHEINNPNHAIRLNASLLSKIWTSARPILDAALEGEEDTLLGGIEYGELRDKIPTMLTGLLDASAHIESIIGGLRDFSRPAKDEEDEEVRIDLVVEASLRLLGAYIHAATSHFRLELDPGLPAARASFHGLEQVLINLIQNACQSLEDPTKAIVIHGSFDSVAGRLSIVVADEGRGMSPEELAQIRDPFFTTRRGEGGLGLGIPISVTIVEKFGGSLAFDSESGRGTRAIIELPAWEPGKDFSA